MSSDRESTEKFLRGEWSVDDLIESAVDSEVDETSVAANAGSGTQRSLGYARYGADDKLEKIFQEFEEWVRYEREESSRRNLKEYGRRRGLPESLAHKLAKRLQK